MHSRHLGPEAHSPQRAGEHLHLRGAPLQKQGKWSPHLHPSVTGEIHGAREATTRTLEQAYALRCRDPIYYYRMRFTYPQKCVYYPNTRPTCIYCRLLASERFLARTSCHEARGRFSAGPLGLACSGCGRRSSGRRGASPLECTRVRAAALALGDACPCALVAGAGLWRRDLSPLCR